MDNTQQETSDPLSRSGGELLTLAHSSLVPLPPSVLRSCPELMNPLRERDIDIDDDDMLLDVLESFMRWCERVAAQRSKKRETKNQWLSDEEAGTAAARLLLYDDPVGYEELRTRREDILKFPGQPDPDVQRARRHSKWWRPMLRLLKEYLADNRPGSFVESTVLGPAMPRSDTFGRVADAPVEHKRALVPLKADEIETSRVENPLEAELEAVRELWQFGPDEDPHLELLVELLGEDPVALCVVLRAIRGNAHVSPETVLQEVAAAVAATPHGKSVTTLDAALSWVTSYLSDSERQLAASLHVYPREDFTEEFLQEQAVFAYRPEDLTQLINIGLVTVKAPDYFGVPADLRGSTTDVLEPYAPDDLVGRIAERRGDLAQEKFEAVVADRLGDSLLLRLRAGLTADVTVPADPEQAREWLECEIETSMPLFEWAQQHDYRMPQVFRLMRFLGKFIEIRSIDDPVKLSDKLAELKQADSRHYARGRRAVEEAEAILAEVGEDLDDDSDVAIDNVRSGKTRRPRSRKRWPETRQNRT